MRWLGFVVLAGCAGCGRIAFEPVGTGSTDDGGGGPGDGAFGCPVIAQCPDRDADLGTSSSVGAGVDLDHGLSSGMCGVGSNTAELVVAFTPNRDGRFTIDASPSSIGVYAQECCGGRELACGNGPITVQRAASEQFVVIVEATVGTQVFIQVTLD